MSNQDRKFAKDGPHEQAASAAYIASHCRQDASFPPALSAAVERLHEAGRDVLRLIQEIENAD